MFKTNTDWAAHKIADALDKNEICILQDQLKSLVKILDQSWAKDLTLTELLDAVNQANKIISDSK